MFIFKRDFLLRDKRMDGLSVRSNMKNLRKHSVYPYCGKSHLPSSIHTRLRSPLRKKPSLHSNVTTAPGVNWKLDLRPNRGVSSIPHESIRL
jgi:hypothetical protein